MLNFLDSSLFVDIDGVLDCILLLENDVKRSMLWMVSIHQGVILRKSFRKGFYRTNAVFLVKVVLMGRDVVNQVLLMGCVLL